MKDCLHSLAIITCMDLSTNLVIRLYLQFGIFVQVLKMVLLQLGTQKKSMVISINKEMWLFPASGLVQNHSSILHHLPLSETNKIIILRLTDRATSFVNLAQIIHIGGLISLFHGRDI